MHVYECVACYMLQLSIIYVPLNAKYERAHAFTWSQQ